MLNTIGKHSRVEVSVRGLEYQKKVDGNIKLHVKNEAVSTKEPTVYRP